MQQKDIPCNLISSWHPSGNCNDDKLIIYNQSNQNILNITWGEYSPVCNATFTLTPEGTYYLNSTIENYILTIQNEDEMGSISITIFLMVINIVLFILPFMVRFAKNEIWQYVWKQLIWIMAFVFLWFNTNIMVTLADKQGLGITPQLKTIFLIFTIGMMAVIILMCYMMLVTPFKIHKALEKKKYMGVGEVMGDSD